MPVIKARIMLAGGSTLCENAFARPSGDALYVKIRESSLQFYDFLGNRGESPLYPSYKIVTLVFGSGEHLYPNFIFIAGASVLRFGSPFCR